MGVMIRDILKGQNQVPRLLSVGGFSYGVVLESVL